MMAAYRDDAFSGKGWEAGAACLLLPDRAGMKTLFAS